MIKTNKFKERKRLIVILSTLLALLVIYLIIHIFTGWKENLIQESYTKGEQEGQDGMVNYIIGNEMIPVDYIKGKNSTEVNWLTFKEFSDLECDK